MNPENIAKFTSILSTDPALQQKLRTINQESGRAVAEQVAALSTEVGTPFTADELIDSLQNQASEELSDEELEAVAGGRGMSTEMKVFLSVISVGFVCAGMGDRVESRARRCRALHLTVSRQPNDPKNERRKSAPLPTSRHRRPCPGQEGRIHRDTARCPGMKVVA